MEEKILLDRSIDPTGAVELRLASKRVATLWNTRKNAPYCEHMFSQGEIIHWLENKHPLREGLCPRCEISRTERPLCDPTEITHFKSQLCKRRIYGNDYADKGSAQYRPDIILNQGALVKILKAGGSVAEFIPEFYDNNCPFSNGVFEYEGYLGEGSFGTVYSVSVQDRFLKQIITVDIVDKTIELPRRFGGLEDNFVNGKYVVDTDGIKEILISTLVSDFFMSQQCPHFPLFYGGFTCAEDSPRRKLKIDNSAHILGEKIDIALGEEGYELGIEDTPDYLMNVCFQCIVAIAKMQESYKMVHGDLHAGNVMIKHTRSLEYMWGGKDLATKGTVLKYVLQNQDFVLPNNHALVKIVDFGLSSTFGRPSIVSSSSILDTEDEEYISHATHFNSGFDLVTFIDSFLFQVCWDAFIRNQDSPWGKARERADEIFSFSRSLALDLFLPYMRTVSMEDSLQVQKLREAGNFGELQKAMEISGVLKYIHKLEDQIPRPHRSFAKTVSPLAFLLEGNTFAEFRGIKTEPWPTQPILMTTVLGTQL